MMTEIKFEFAEEKYYTITKIIDKTQHYVYFL